MFSVFCCTGLNSLLSWMEMLKAVDQPVAQVAMISQLRGIMDEYDHNTAEVLLLEGEVHSNTKPGHIRFTTAEARTDFAGLVLKGVRRECCTPSLLQRRYLACCAIAIPPIRELAERLARRLQDMNEGRQWMSAHMRRGDCAPLPICPSRPCLTRTLV